MIRTPRPEQWPKERVGEDAVVEDLLEAMECLLATRMFEQRGHRCAI
jgi:hypothetical protein